MRKLRIGAVSYLNTKPLIYGLERRAADLELVLDVPSRLADELAADRLDVALVPSIELLREPRYVAVSDACIACRGPVLSVKLFSRVPLDQIRTLALDEGSRTSVALVQILLCKKFNLRPRLEPLAVGATIDDTDADAVLLIGDRAIHSPRGQFAAVWDLGDQWCRWAGLPFVFAAWTARGDVPLEGLERVLADARSEGVAHLDEIARREAPALGLTEPQCLAYLRDNLHFYLGPEEQQGLERFRACAAELGLISKTDARLHDYQPAR